MAPACYQPKRMPLAILPTLSQSLCSFIAAASSTCHAHSRTAPYSDSILLLLSFCRAEACADSLHHQAIHNSHCFLACCCCPALLQILLLLLECCTPCIFLDVVQVVTAHNNGACHLSGLYNTYAGKKRTFIRRLQCCLKVTFMGTGLRCRQCHVLLQ